MLGVLVVVAWFTGASAASGAELLVSAAISLKEPLQEIGARFEQRHSDIKVVFNWGGSGALQQQIEHGAPVDVYIAAASTPMDALEAKGLVLDGTRRTLAGNRLVLMVPRTHRSTVTSLRELTGSGIGRIAIGNPRTVPAGRYARDMLVGAGLWDVLKPKLVFTEHVRQAVAYVVRGEVDAALVYATDAQSAGAAVQVVAIAPHGNSPLVHYPVAVIRTSQRRFLAEAFVDLALGEVGQGILKAHGFVPPPTLPTGRSDGEAAVGQR